MLALAKQVQDAVRVAEVLQVLVRHGFADLVQWAGLHEGLPARLLRKVRLLETPSGEPETRGQRLRAALTELGPTYVKFGQILSTRPDVVGVDVAQSLSELQDRVKAVPFDAMAAVIEAELGAGVDALFGAFNKDPVAAASLSQVYLATLKSGEAVAVKVQRPGIERVIERDLSLLTRVAEWVAEHVEEIALFDPQGVVEEFARSIRRELDFTIERLVIERFRQNFDGVDDVFVPHVYGDVSSKRVVTMDWVDGARLDALDQYPARNCEAGVVARVGCRVVCQQVFEHHLFHADPHPGNIFITRDNQICFLDYGMVGHLERTDAAILADLLHGVFREDVRCSVDALLMLSTGEPRDREALEHEAADFLAFEGRAIVADGRVGDGIERMVEILRRNRLQLAPRFSLLLKALATIESVAHLLDPAMDVVPIIQSYVEQLVARRYMPHHIMREMQAGMAELMKLGREVPVEVHQLLRMLRRGTLKMQLNHEGLDRLSNVTDRASNRITFGIIAGSIIIGSSLLITTGGGAHPLGIGGFIAAGVLGVSLLVSILRSRNY